jgi:hypothetical protein
MVSGVLGTALRYRLHRWNLFAYPLLAARRATRAVLAVSVPAAGPARTPARAARPQRWRCSRCVRASRWLYARTAGFDYVQMDDTEYVLLSAPVMDGVEPRRACAGRSTRCASATGTR